MYLSRHKNCELSATPKQRKQVKPNKSVVNVVAEREKTQKKTIGASKGEFATTKVA